MAKLTPEEIQKLSEPIEKAYSDTVDALLINMAKHFQAGQSLPAQEWEIRKLAELGQLSRESLRILASMTGQNPERVREALQGAARAAARGVEPELERAVREGRLAPPDAGTATASRRIAEALEASSAQAVEKLNLVNATMLESTLEQYRKAIANTAHLERMQAAQGAPASRTEALRQALSRIHAEGIAGFIDKAGRKWSPEAAVSMDIRTAVHNTAIEAVKRRQEDYGTAIFRVSRHSGARPLCYPYQGRYFSWDNTSGTFTDGEGKRHRYSPLSSTSYGKPAGLFGIHCGHEPIPVIPGVSIPRDRTEQDKEANDKAYAESQEQRRLEREVRAAKQKAAMLDAAGDKEGFEKEAAKVKQKQADYDAFCKKTGRTKRLDRTQVFEYNRSVSGKATAAVKRAEAAKRAEEQLHTQYKGYLGTGTAAQTAAKVRAITEQGDKWLLDGFVKAVDKGEISVLVGIDIYLATAREIEEKLVGVVTADGMKIQGYVTHFVDRIIGQTSTSHEDMRKGVPVANALDTLLHGKKTPIIIQENGKRSQKLIGKTSVVTVNPDTKFLIQTNPRS